MAEVVVGRQRRALAAVPGAMEVTWSVRVAR